MFAYKKFLILSGMIALLSACTTTQKETRYVPVSAKPTVAKNNLSNKFMCYERKIKANPYIFANKDYSMGLFVKDITDGTIPVGSVNDSPLVDSGRLQMLSSLGKLFGNHPEIMVGYYFPRALENTDTGINIFGYIDDNATREMGNGQLYSMNNKIRIEFTPFVEATKADFFIIDGTFSRNDSDDGVFNRGFASSAEYEKTTKASAEFGKNKSKKYLSLTVLIAHPVTNTLLNSETFELSLEKHKSTAELKVGRSNINTGITIEREQIESLHSAQQLLIDYAALWVAQQFAQNNPKLFMELQKC